MCRYAGKWYKDTYACFKCRKGFKRRLDVDLLSPKEWRVAKQAKFQKLLYKKEVDDKIRYKAETKCPDCGGTTTNLGRDLRLPQRESKQQWLAIAYLVSHQFNFFSCGCSGIGHVPQNLKEAQEWVNRHGRKSEGEQLLERINK